MNLSVGIVGLPNVGKSTLFNALLKKQQAFVANFPFATIEPNVGIVPVPDSRLEKLADIVAVDLNKETPFVANTSSRSLLGRPPIVPAIVKFVDIAGLVKGASEGAGLGNKFLSHIREVSLVCHVVRAFEDDNVVREGSSDPKSDYETVQTELILADLQTVQNSKLKTQNFSDKILAELNKGIPVRDIALKDEEKELNDSQLLTAKPEIIVLNVSEKDYSEDKILEVIKQYSQALKLREEKFVVISAKIEAELAELSEVDQKQYLKDLGLQQSGLERLIKKAYQTLGLISFLTAGEKEIRAWTIQKGTTAIAAAGVIHTDFIKNFIKAEVVSFDDFINLGGWKKAREVGKMRFEGRDYIIKDGDVVEFKIGSSFIGA